jgi:hypothetical protein
LLSRYQTRSGLRHCPPLRLSFDNFVAPRLPPQPEDAVRLAGGRAGSSCARRRGPRARTIAVSSAPTPQCPVSHSTREDQRRTAVTYLNLYSCAHSACAICAGGTGLPARQHQ